MVMIDVAWEGGTGTPAIFLHANGFHPLAYLPFLRALSDKLHITALATRPLCSSKPPSASVRWKDIGLDVVQWLTQRNSPPVLAIGHSLGGTALMYAAAAHPEQFSGLVFVEPAMVRPYQAKLLSYFPMSLRAQIQPAKATLHKRDTWEDEASFRRSCAKSGLYKRVPQDAMDALVKASIRPCASGVTLTYPKEWEAHFYMTPPFPGHTLSQVNTPVIGIRGEPSIFLDDNRWNRCIAGQPKGWFAQLDQVGHLLPLEAPRRAASTILEGIRAQGL